METKYTTDDKYTDDRVTSERDWDEGRSHRKRRVMSAGTLTGDRVRNAAGEDLGKIEEIMLDLLSGRIAYAVLSFGGFLGIGDKLFAVPWDQLQVDEENHEFVLNVDKERLENAPGFDKDNWPDMADPDWGTQVYSHYGSKPYWNRDEGDRYLKDQGEYGSERFDREGTATTSGTTPKGGGD